MNNRKNETLIEFSTIYPIVIDASAKIPDGVFLYNSHFMGAFDECLNLITPSSLKWKNDFIEGFR